MCASMVLGEQGAGAEYIVFLPPADVTKNGDERIVVLNRIARGVVESERGRHPKYVFSYKGKRLARMNNHAWRRARERAGLLQVRVHDLRHYSEFRIIPTNLHKLQVSPLFSVTCTPSTA